MVVKNLGDRTRWLAASRQHDYIHLASNGIEAARRAYCNINNYLGEISLSLDEWGNMPMRMQPSSVKAGDSALSYYRRGVGISALLVLYDVMNDIGDISIGLAGNHNSRELIEFERELLKKFKFLSRSYILEGDAQR